MPMSVQKGPTHGKKVAEGLAGARMQKLCKFQKDSGRTKLGTNQHGEVKLCARHVHPLVDGSVGNAHIKKCKNRHFNLEISLFASLN